MAVATVAAEGVAAGIAALRLEGFAAGLAAATAAMDGITNQSRTPIRFLCILGFVLAILSFMLTLSYLFLKIFYWDAFQIGTAPILIGLFFFCSIQMFFMGLIGEYIGEMHNRLRKVPLVIESERINF